MKRYIPKCLAALLLLVVCNACKQKGTAPIQFPDPNPVIEVTYQELGGVMTIPVKINKTTIDMIFDSGFGGTIAFSNHELNTLAKNNKIDMDDFIGLSQSQIADGSIVDELVFQIRTVEIVGDNGETLKLKQNTPAVVTPNDNAPALIGRKAFDGVASVEVDNVKKVIRFKTL